MSDDPHDPHDVGELADLPCIELVELVTEYLDDTLTPDVRARVDAHLPYCDGCSSVLAQFLPATHFIKISRGIIIRGANFWDLWPSVVALIVLAALLVAGSTRAFRKTIS